MNWILFLLFVILILLICYFIYSKRLFESVNQKVELSNFYKHYLKNKESYDFYITIGAFIIIIVSSLSLFFSILKNNLGKILNLEIFLYIFVFGFTMYFMVIFYRSHLFKINKSKKRILEILKKVDNYVILSIFLFAMIISAGTLFIVLNYSPDFNYKFENDTNSYFLEEVQFYDTYINENVSVTYTRCKSLNRNEYIVYNDKIMCYTIFKHKYNTSVGLVETYENLNNGSRIRIDDFSSNYINSNNREQLIIDVIPTSNGKFLDYTIEYNINNLDNGESHLFHRLNFRKQPISYEKAEEKRLKRLSYFFGVLAIAFFSVLAGVKNLKDLIESKK